MRERNRDLDLDKTGNVRGQADPEAAALDEEDGVLGSDGDPGPGDLAGEGDVLGGAPEPGHSPAAGLGRESLGLSVGQAIEPLEEVGDEGLGRIIVLCLALADCPLEAAAPLHREEGEGCNGRPDVSVHAGRGLQEPELRASERRAARA